MIIQTLCQPDADGRCTQCGQPVPPRLKRNCPAKRRDLAADQRRALRTRAGRWLGEALADVRPCRWLGPTTGRVHKAGCGGRRTLAEHWCYHPAHRRQQRRRHGTGPAEDGRTTPGGRCRDLDGLVVTCVGCRLREPQRFLPSEKGLTNGHA